jgi:hypothetical protein
MPFADIVAAVENLSAEEYDRLRLRLWRQFGQQLRRMPDAPTPDDLLHDAIEDLLADRRHCPLARVDFVICLMNIVRSKVSHLYEKWKQNGINIVSEELLTKLQMAAENGAPDDASSELEEKILACLADDARLTAIVEYRLDHPEARAQEIAEHLGFGMQDMYNANRRLKARLRRMNTSGS